MNFTELCNPLPPTMILYRSHLPYRYVRILEHTLIHNALLLLRAIEEAKVCLLLAKSCSMPAIPCLSWMIVKPTSILDVVEHVYINVGLLSSGTVTDIGSDSSNTFLPSVCRLAAMAGRS